MFLVFGGVGGDRFVAELGELDPQLPCGDEIRSVAHARPVPSAGRMGCRSPGDVGPSGQTLGHCVRQVAERSQQFLSTGSGLMIRSCKIADHDREEKPGGDLTVERLGRCHAHFDVSAIGRVQHTFGPIGEVASSPVDDGEHRGASLLHEIDRAIRIGCGTGLRDGDHQRVGHVLAKTESRELCGHDRLHADVIVELTRDAAATAWPTMAAVPWPMTRMCLIAPSDSFVAMCGGIVDSPTLTDNSPSISVSLPRRVLRNERGDSVISLRR